jgi:DNA (cytosine-5)-methyltransferase 1
MPALPESRGEGINVDMLNGLSLFTGIGGIDLALSEWVRPVAYCENDRYAQSVTLSRMAEGKLPIAPIWDDVTTLSGEQFNKRIDIIYGGFPCQDISIAGLGKGLEGERSGLVFEIFRLTDELKPAFVFLENVPAIRTRGLDRVLQEFTKRRYDCRWTMLSASEVGANHKRERWFLLAYNNSFRGRAGEPERKRVEAELCGEDVSKSSSQRCDMWSSDRKRGYIQNNENREFAEVQQEWRKRKYRTSKICEDVTDTASKGLQGQPQIELERKQQRCVKTGDGDIFSKQWWLSEPDVGRVANGVQNRVDRIKCMGNAVVPLQAKTAFERLMGITE